MEHNVSPETMMHSPMDSLSSNDKEMQLAMAYIVMQSQITQLYKTEFALKQGTIFPELDKPFMRGRGDY